MEPATAATNPGRRRRTPDADEEPCARLGREDHVLVPRGRPDRAVEGPAKFLELP